MAEILRLLFWVVLIPLNLVLALHTSTGASEALSYSSISSGTLPPTSPAQEFDILDNGSCPLLLKRDLPLPELDMEDLLPPHTHEPLPSSSRPRYKPSLLTDYEYETFWEPRPGTLRIGVLLPLNAPPGTGEDVSARKALTAIRMAMDNINTQKIVPGVNVSLLLRDSRDPSLYTLTPGAAPIIAASSLINSKVGGVIGDIHSHVTHLEALITSSAQIPQCSFGATNTLLSNTKVYPYFYRTIPTTIVLIDAMFKVIMSSGWQRIMFIYDINTLGYAGREYFQAQAEALNIFILGYAPLTMDGVPDDPTFRSVKETIDGSQSRIQVLIAAGQLENDFLREMKKTGYMSSQFGWVVANEVSASLRNESHVEEYDGMIMVDNAWQLDGYEPYETFASQWMQLNSTEYPGAADPVLDKNEGSAYACVIMMAQVYADLIHRTVGNNPDDFVNSTFIGEVAGGYHVGDINVTNYYQDNPFEGPSGPILLNHNGDRSQGPYRAMSMQRGEPILFATISGDNYTVIKDTPFKGQHPLPKDASLWTIRNPKWDLLNGRVYGVLCSIGILATLLFAGLVHFYRENIVIKASSPQFCLLELLGILIIFVRCLLYIGIPTNAICMARNLLLPAGVTLLAGSLTIKNYRIYRIFNSLTVVNQSFDTGLLMCVVGLAALTSLIPMIVAAVIDPPLPTKINIGAHQWVVCQSNTSELLWNILSAVTPVFLILFGVFLAFKTRNVAFLWNDAKQIALVLYNSLFFTLIIVITRFLPADIYMASFYISMIATFLVVFLSLVILFLPKFWLIWRGTRGSQRRAAAGLWDQGMGPGGMGVEADRIMGSRSELLQSYSSTSVIAGSSSDFEKEGPTYSTMEVRRGSRVVSESSAMTFAPSPLITTEDHITKLHALDRDSNENPDSRAIANSSPERVLSIGLPSNSERPYGNPLDLWMSARLPKKKQDLISTFASGGEDQDGRNIRGMFLDPRELNGDESGSRGPPAFFSSLQTSTEPLSSELRPENTFQTNNSGAHRRLDSYVFLLPILVERPFFLRFLGHWFMATLILVPEAHAFLAVNSASGTSTSYLMLTMSQVRTESEPTLRITTRNSGTLLIRFSSQARLEGWMRTFSEEDLRILSEDYTPPMQPTGSSTNFLGDNPIQSSIGTSAQRRSMPPPRVNGSMTMDMFQGVNVGVDLDTGCVTSTVDTGDRGSELDTWKDHTIETENDNGEQHLRVKPPSPDMHDDEGASTLPPRRSEGSRTQNCNYPLTPKSEITQRGTAAPSDGEQPLPASLEDRMTDTATAAISTHRDLHASAPLPTTSENVAVLIDASASSDDDEDLYDPEFGIGGNGRRRQSHRASSATLLIPSAAVISTAAAAVSAGWTESDALAAAMEDPSGSFLNSIYSVHRAGADAHPLAGANSSANNSTAGSRRGSQGSLNIFNHG